MDWNLVADTKKKKIIQIFKRETIAEQNLIPHPNVSAALSWDDDQPYWLTMSKAEVRSSSMRTELCPALLCIMTCYSGVTIKDLLFDWGSFKLFNSNLSYNLWDNWQFWDRSVAVRKRRIKFRFFRKYFFLIIKNLTKQQGRVEHLEEQYTEKLIWQGQKARRQENRRKFVLKQLI